MKPLKEKKPAYHFVFPAVALLAGPATLDATTEEGGNAATTPMVTVSTFAGGGKGFAEGKGSGAQFCFPGGITIDAEGNLYVTDDNRIRKITAKREVSTLAGSVPGEIQYGSECKSIGGYTDGKGSEARFGYLRGIAVDKAGNLYVGDGDNHRIRKITKEGVVSTLADGKGSEVQFYFFDGIVIDAASNLYVMGSTSILKVTKEGEVSTFVGPERSVMGSNANDIITSARFVSLAGTEESSEWGERSGFVDGVGNAARFTNLRAIAIDPAGNLYVVDSTRIRKVTKEGEVSTLAGSGESGFADGVGSAAQFSRAEGIAVDAAGNLYVADTSNNCIRKVTPKGEVSTLAGNRESGFADGPGSTARFSHPRGITIDKKGNLYVTANTRIRRIAFNVLAENDASSVSATPTVTVSTLAGSDKKGPADGSGSEAQFAYTRSAAIDKVGNLFVTDGSRIRKITMDGEVSTFGDDKAAGFSSLTGIAIDKAGNLYVVDRGKARIHKVSTDGEVSTFAGSGTQGFSDGFGSAAQFKEPHGLAIDEADNLYVADTSNNRIRKITPKGEVSTLAGRKEGFANGTGKSARFSRPSGIAIDAAGNLYVADTYNSRIRKITKEGVVSTFAGSMEYGYEDGSQSAAQFFKPHGIAIDKSGHLYVTDGDRIRKVTIEGEVSTLAGNRESGFADGKGSTAKFNDPSGIAIDKAGNLYVTDGKRIRKVVIE
ncbi:MAG: hypothetical protein LBE22_08385 [Azoarcus sp.]|jgi:sugar lactone lactonase YvrE|nr:hypothetical protein [Azoarcus sp.]